MAEALNGNTGPLVAAAGFVPKGVGGVLGIVNVDEEVPRVGKPVDEEAEELAVKLNVAGVVVLLPAVVVELTLILN